MLDLLCLGNIRQANSLMYGDGFVYLQIPRSDVLVNN